MNNNKITLKIKLFSSDQSILDYHEKYLYFFFNLNKKNIKLYKLPIKQKTFVLLKSPHVNKKSKEHFYFEGNYRIIQIKICKLQLFYYANILKNINNIETKISYVEE
jgi:ribosomal protein S10